MINNIAYSIPISIIYTLLIGLLISKVLISLPLPLPDIFKFVIFLFIFYGLYGYIVSYLASYEKCKKVNHLRSIYHGIRTGLFLGLGYILTNYFDFFKEPFIEIFQDNGSYFGDIFFLSLVTILTSLTNIYDSSKYSCLSAPHEIKKNLIPLDNYLSSEVEEEENNNIILKE